jgi:hypothetical protein
MTTQDALALILTLALCLVAFILVTRYTWLFITDTIEYFRERRKK